MSALIDRTVIEFPMFILGLEDALKSMRIRINDEFADTPSPSSSTLFESMQASSLRDHLDVEEKLYEDEKSGSPTILGPSSPVDEGTEESFLELLKKYETKDTEELRKIVAEGSDVL